MRRWVSLLVLTAVLGAAMGVGVRQPAPARAHDRWSKDNLTLLAMVVSGEAKGEPYEGQVAVASVILNRVDHRDFPNSVAGVVYEPDAFESVTNGEIYRGICDTCWSAAADALNGWDPTWGATFFFNPAMTNHPFIWSRPQVRQIGKHIFAR